jgi:hypothetical protein
MWVHTYYSHRIQLSARVKACAWIYANNGCTQVPAECNSLTVHTGDGLDADALPAGQSSDLVAFAQLPIVHNIVEIVLGQSAEVRRQETVNRPPVLGGGGSNIFSNQSVMCNENPRDPGTIAHDAFCNLTHIC